jgi:hypothetical protein
VIHDSISRLLGHAESSSSFSFELSITGIGRSIILADRPTAAFTAHSLAKNIWGSAENALLLSAGILFQVWYLVIVFPLSFFVLRIWFEHEAVCFKSSLSAKNETVNYQLRVVHCCYYYY